MTYRKPVPPMRSRAPVPAPAPTPAPTYRQDRLKLRHLRLLDLIGRHGSIGRAAREIGVSQPAATLLVREIETAFGASLVERDRRGARLTAAGSHAVARLQAALASIGRAIEAARETDGEPPLRLGCVQVAGVRTLPEALAHLETTGFAGRLQVREGRARDLLGDLCAGRLDAVVGWLDETIADGLPIDELAIDPIREGRMQVVAAASHPLARSRSVSVGELSRARWIVPPPESRTHAAYRRLFVSYGAAPPPVAVECASLHASLRIVSTTRMLAVAPDDAVSAYRRLGMIAALRGRSLDLGHAPLSVFTRRDLPASPAMLALRGALRAGRG